MSKFRRRKNKVFFAKDEQENIALNEHDDDEVFIQRENKGKDNWKSLRNTVRAGNAFRKQKNTQAAFEVNTNLNVAPKMESHCLLSLNETGKSSKQTVTEEKTHNKEVLITHTEKCTLLNNYTQQGNKEELIHYFINLSEIDDISERVVNYDFLEMLILNGIDVNTVDSYGQCVLHEVARAWHVDVAKFLILRGAQVNQPDDFGRTPLHIACTVDYSEMVEFLIENNADINIKTYGEEQSPIHFAAKNDAVEAMKSMLRHGADINVTDYMKRSPLQVAAEHDRVETAQALLQAGALVGCYDENMNSPIVVLIKKMPNVALTALKQFHQRCRLSRHEYFHLNHLNPPIERFCAKSPLQVAVECKQLSILMHPVFNRLIEIKWEKLGRWGAYVYGAANLLLTLIWTMRLGFFYAHDSRLSNGFWTVISVLSFLICICSELKELVTAHRQAKSYRKWKEELLLRDMQFAHPKWPQERLFIEREIQRVREEKTTYSKDMWNYFDWITYTAMFASIIAKICFTEMKATKNLKYVMSAIGSITLICLWLRMLKYSRPFKTLGPFIAILNHIIIDAGLILYLGLHIFIPYVVSFWIVFGHDGINGYTFKDLDVFYNVFLMSVGGQYETQAIDKHSPIVAKFLCFTNILFGAVICINLFVALMSNTFQRVYDNMCANATYQRAVVIIDFEADLFASILQKHRQWIEDNCSPERFFCKVNDDGDDDDELKRLLCQIKATNDQLFTKFSSYSEGNEESNSTSYAKFTDVENLKAIVLSSHTQFLETLKETTTELSELKVILQDLVEENKKQTLRNRTNKLTELLKDSIQNKHWSSQMLAEDGKITPSAVSNKDVPDSKMSR